MMKSLHRLAADNRAAAVIELAFIAPIVAVTVIGIVDVSNAFSRKLALEQGAQRAIEKIMQTTEDDTVENTLKTEAVCQVDGTNSDGSCKSTPITAADVTVNYRQDCTDKTSGAITATTTNTTGTFTACTAGLSDLRYISIIALDKYTPMFPIHFGGFNTSDGTYHLSATAGMRTS